MSDTKEIQILQTGEEPIAILAEVHSNLEALEAVLADIERRGIKKIVFAGDAVGYGPDPITCLDHIMKFDLAIKGNHDELVCNPENEDAIWSKLAYKSALGTSDMLKSADERYIKFLLGLSDKGMVFHDDFVLNVFHGSPNENNHHQYLFPPISKYNYRPGQTIINHLIDELKAHCIVGHTHFPAILFRGGYFIPIKMKNRYILGEKPVIINPGAVGQPRDLNNNASYAILKGDTITFYRVKYDIDKTCKKIMESEIYGIDDSIRELACRRLRSGC